MTYFGFPGIRAADLPKKLGLEETLFKILESEYKITKEVLASKTRKREITLFRHLFCYFMSKRSHHSLSAIGSFIGNRDHTTVIHSVRTVEDLLSIHDPIITEIRDNIRSLLKP